jgi:hypothetical protein
MHKKLPEFLGIGTQKGGTTTLHQLLTSHPQVFLPKCKEIHFFSLHYEKGTDWYANHFKDAAIDQIKGEITPLYLFDAKVPKRIHKILPEVKLITLLRDPVERTLSQIFHARRRGFETLKPKDAIDAEEKRLRLGSQFSMQKHSYIARSRYLEQLERYEKLFSKKNLLIIKSEELFDNKSTAWRRIQDFLDIDIIPNPISLPRANRGKGEAFDIDKSLIRILRDELAETVQGVKNKYDIDWGW